MFKGARNDKKPTQTSKQQQQQTNKQTNKNKREREGGGREGGRERGRERESESLINRLTRVCTDSCTSTDDCCYIVYAHALTAPRGCSLCSFHCLMQSQPERVRVHQQNVPADADA